MAQANLELEKANIEREQLAFEQEIIQQTAQWNLQRDLLATATKARDIAVKRYEITKQRYLIGKISITDLNLAQQEKDRAIETFIGAMRNYWDSYHTIRQLTRSEEHTSELQSLMRISYAVFCLKKTKNSTKKHNIQYNKAHT